MQYLKNVLTAHKYWSRTDLKLKTNKMYKIEFEKKKGVT